MRRRIVVEPPAGDARRERVERKLFEQLAAVRVVERAEAVIPREPLARTRMAVFAGGGLLAAAAMVVLVVGRGAPSAPPPPVAPSRIVTPVGGTSQVTLPGALIEARSDTSIEVQHGEGGAITLVVGRGAVECDVEPRAGRPPFRVIAGHVEVEVIGTRFTVTRTPVPRVDVARGTVRVSAPGGQWLIEAGETWPIVAATARAPEAAPEVEAAPADVEVESPPASSSGAPAKVKSERKRPSEPTSAALVEHEPRDAEQPAASVPTERERARDSYRIAARLERTDPRKAAMLYRAIATDGLGMEPVALLSLAEVQLRLREPASALDTLDELVRRFPAAPNAEDAAWIRYEALRVMGKRDQARGVAADYLRRFPHGAYADRLRQQIR
jgi:hypothetical protein